MDFSRAPALLWFPPGVSVCLERRVVRSSQKMLLEYVTSCKTSAPRGSHLPLERLNQRNGANSALRAGLLYLGSSKCQQEPVLELGSHISHRMEAPSWEWESPESWMCRDRHNTAPKARYGLRYQSNSEAALGTNKYKIKTN